MKKKKKENVKKRSNALLKDRELFARSDVGDWRSLLNEKATE